MQQMYTIADVCEMFKLARSTVLRFITTGKLKGIRLGKSWRIPADAIEEFAGIGIGDYQPPTPPTRRKATPMPESFDLPSLEPPAAQANTAISEAAASKPKSRNAVKQAAYRARQKAKREADEAASANAESEREPTPENAEAMQALANAPRADLPTRREMR